MRYLKTSVVKKLIHEKGKFATREFLFGLDIYIENVIIGACKQWNGHHRRLTPETLPSKKR